MSSTFAEIYKAFFSVFGSGGRMKTEELIPGISFTGQTALITGGTSGLGFETAIHYVNLAADRVIITARTIEKGQVAKSEIEARTERKDVVEVMVLDMDTFGGVKDFVKNLQREVRTIDVILLNAGLHEWEHTVSPEGWEKDIQVNTLSTLLLGFLLVPWMRIIKLPNQVQHLGIVSSSSHLQADISVFPSSGILNFCNQSTSFQDPFHAYGISKLLLMYGFQPLASFARNESGEPDPIVNCVCPGTIKTNIAHGFVDTKGLWVAPVIWLWQWLKGSPAVEGAKCLVNIGAMGPESHGSFKRPYMTDEEYAL